MNSMRIDITKLENLTRGRLRAALEFNWGAACGRGSGNRAKRRAGLPVADPYQARPFGCIAMNRGQLARFMRPARKEKP